MHDPASHPRLRPRLASAANTPWVHAFTAAENAAGPPTGAGDVTASESSRRTTSRPVSEPPTSSNDVLVSILTLLAVLAVACVALVPDLLTPAPVVEHEARTIATAVETWHRLNRLSGDASQLDPWTPYLHGEAITDRPPGGTWWSVASLMPLAWVDALPYVPADDVPAGSGSRPPSPKQILAAVRGGAVVATLLLLTGIFWAGHSIGGYKTGFFASLAALGAVALLVLGRFASAAPIAAGMTSMSLAGAIWAIRPLRPAPSVVRQVLGWLLCGIMLAGAFLTAGWLAAILVLLPLVAIVLLCPGRFGHLMGLLASVGVAMLLVTPWVWHMAGDSEHLANRWLTRWSVQHWPGWDRASLWLWIRLALLLGITLPWTLWLIGAMMQPFSSSSRPVRRRMLIGWLWFLITAVVLVVLGPYGWDATWMLLGLPATAVMFGQVFRQYSDLCKEGRHANLWQGLKWPFLLSMALLSLLLPMALRLQPWATAQGWIDQPFAQTPAWPYLVGSLAVLGILTALIFSYALTHRPGRTLTFASLWAVCAVSLVMLMITRGPLAQSPWQTDADRVLATIGQQPIYYWAPIHTQADAEAADSSANTSPHPPVTLTALLAKPVLPLRPNQIPVSLPGEQPVDTPPLYVLVHQSQPLTENVQVFDAKPLTHGAWRLCMIEVDPPAAPSQTNTAD